MCQIVLGNWLDDAVLGAEQRAGWEWEREPPFLFPDANELVERYITQQGPLFYDLAPVEQDNWLGIEDVLVAVLLDASITRDNVVSLMEPASLNAIDDALVNVPPNLDLRDPNLDDDDAWEYMQQLFDAVLQTVMSADKATKILHKKRPRLIPVVDDYVLGIGDAFGYARGGQDAGTSAGLVMVVRRIRADIMAGENIASLSAIQAAIPGLPGISIVRIFHMIVWQAVRNRQVVEEYPILQ